jgi:hypothetical protein
MNAPTRAATSDIARACAVNLEAKKDGLAQLQDGSWVLKLKVHPADMAVSLMQAAMGTRYVVALVEIDDQEQPVSPKRKEGMPSGPASHRRDTAPPTDGPTPSAGARKPVSLTRQAAIACTEPKFWAFIRERHETPCSSEEEAADFVRMFCGVASRKEIAAGTRSAHAWDSLRGDYLAWEYAD